VLAGVLKNDVFLKRGLYTLYPNQFIILTGPPGIGKGTAINFAWRMTKITNSRLANVLTDRATIPELLRLIAKGWPTVPKIINGQALMATMEHSCTIIASELQTLLASGTKDTLQVFCQLWDQQEYENRTKNQGTDIIRDMCVNLIGGTVPDYIRGMERDLGAVIAGGYTARCIFIHADKKSKELPDEPTIESIPKSLELYNKLKNDLLYIASNVKGEFKISEEARLIFSNYYPATSALPDDSDAMLNFKERIKTHIFKLSMILSAARKDSLIIEGQDIRDAIFLITSVRRQLDKVFRGIGSSQLAEPTAKVQSIIERYGMCTKLQLIQSTHRHFDPAVLDRVLYVLETIGFLTIQKRGGKIYYVQIPKGNQGMGLGSVSKSVNIP